jgi:hypothetical protein
MNFKNVLRLRARFNDSFVTYPDGDEDNQLLIRIEDVSPDGSVTLAFQGDDHKVWRSKIYKRGQMTERK